MCGCLWLSFWDLLPDISCVGGGTAGQLLTPMNTATKLETKDETRTEEPTSQRKAVAANFKFSTNGPNIARIIIHQCNT